jgi:hypothetical protein
MLKGMPLGFGDELIMSRYRLPSVLSRRLYVSLSESSWPGTPRRLARSPPMLEFLSGLIWPVVIVATTISIAIGVGVFIATRKLD